MEKGNQIEEMMFGDLEAEKRLAETIHLFAGFSLSEDASKEIAKVIYKAGSEKVSAESIEESNLFSMLDSKLLQIVFSEMFREDLLFEDAFKIAIEKNKNLINILREIEIYDVFRTPMAGEDFIVFPKLRECLGKYDFYDYVEKFSENIEIKEVICEKYLRNTLEGDSLEIALNGLEPNLANILLANSVAKMQEESKRLVEQALISILVENSIEQNRKISTLMEEAQSTNDIDIDTVYNKLLEIYKWGQCNIDIIYNMMF